MQENLVFKRNGYVCQYLPSHHLAAEDGTVYEHRLVAEEILGRRLLDSEVVHHIDGNRSNNQNENLLIFKTVGDHTAFHSGDEIERCGDVWVAIKKTIKKINSNGGINKVDLCPNCKKEFKTYKAQMCKGCYLKYIDSTLPDEETLKGLICNFSFVKIGRLYNVTDNAVRKWCKKYNLPFKYHDVQKYKIERRFLQS